MADVITIDGAGRVVIPKSVRDHLGLKDGSRLRVIEQGTRVVLEAIDVPPQVVEKDGLLVLRGPHAGSLPTARDVHDERARALAERAKKR